MGKFWIYVVLSVCCMAHTSCTGKGQQATVPDDLPLVVDTPHAGVGIAPHVVPHVIPQGTFAKHIVVLRPGETQQDRDRIAAGLTKSASHVYNTVFVGFAADISQSEFLSLTADSRIAYIEEDGLVQLCRPIPDNHPNDDPWDIRDDLAPTVFTEPAADPIPHFGDNAADWGVLRMNAFPAPGLQGAGVTVAIIDTGVDTDHPDLAGSLLAEYDAVNDVAGAGMAEDLHGHGTHVSGIVGARDNDIHTVGVAPLCSFAAIKVFAGASGSGSDADLIRGIDWVAANQAVLDPPIKVVNMSLSGTGTMRAMYDAVQACNDLGITTVVAAGNDFRDASQQMPANFDNVITVSAMRRVWNAGAYDYKFAMFSNWGNTVDLIAPGQGIRSLWNNGATRFASGTSMACPHVAGAAALYLDENLADGFEEVMAALVADGEAGTWTGDPDGVYEPLVDVYEPLRGDWWMFGHDRQHTRRSPFVAAQTNNLKWSYHIGGVERYSSAAFGADGTIYVSGNGSLHALHPDGTLNWSFATGPLMYSSPAIGEDGTVYAGGWDHNLYAINPDGTVKWFFTTGASVNSSPAIGEDGTVYVGSWDNELYAINPDGTLKWSYPTGNWVWSSPAIGNDGTIYVGSFDNNLYAINPDGTFKWSYATGEYVWSSPSIAPDGTVFVGSQDDNLHAVNPDGTLKWLFNTGGDVNSSPAIGADGTVYVRSDDFNLYSINPDGTENWSYDTGDLGYTSPAIGADGTVYGGNFALNPDGSLKWLYGLGPVVWNSPAIGADGTVYFVDTSGTLYAIGS